MKKKLILVLPVDKSVVHFNAIAPPLGLGIVAALTPEHWDVEIVDENFDTFTYKYADLVGITSWTVNINRAYEIAEICRAQGTPVVMGGPHVSALPDEALEHCDYVIRYQAENTWEVFIRDFENGKAEKIYDKEAGNTFVKPRHDLFHEDYILGAIQTTRGCPMDCEFCMVTQLNGFKYFRKKHDDVVAELADIPQKFVFFIDDNFAGHTYAHEKDTEALLDAIIASGLKKYWYTQTSINFGANDALLRKAAKAGCGSVLIGFEAETEEALQTINKNLNIKHKPENYKTYIDNIQKHGIGVIAATIFGLETDTEKSMQHRASFLRQINAASITTTILTPFPGTRFFERLKSEGKLVYSNYPHDWRYYNCRFLVYKPDGCTNTSSYEAQVKAIYLRAYKPLSLFFRALKTLWFTKRLFVVMHSYSANIKYRNFLLGKNSSYYRLRLIVSRILVGNTSRKKR